MTCINSDTQYDTSSKEIREKFAVHDKFSPKTIAGAGRITCHDSKDLPHEGQVVGLVKLRGKV